MVEVPLGLAPASDLESREIFEEDVREMPPRRGRSRFWIGMLIVATIVAGCTTILVSVLNKRKQSSKICPSDAKVCPDGSAVGRDADNGCEYSPCPTPGEECPKEIKLCPDGQTVSRSGPGCQFAPCESVNFCMADTKECWDGSKVSRDPANNCLFRSCPDLPSDPFAQEEQELDSEACPEEIKMCTDGATSVSRTGPNCNFGSCPAGSCLVDARACSDESIVHRDPNNNCEFHSCPCPRETKMCSDFSFVTRVGEDCELEECPEGACLTDSQECPDGSTVGRDPSKDCAFFACPVVEGQEDEDCPPVRVCQDAALTTVGLIGTGPCEYAPCP